MRTAREILVLMAVAALLAAVSGYFHPRRPSLHEEALAPDEVELAIVRKWGDKVLWVDARQQADYVNGHIPGSVLLNEDHWDGFLPALLDVWQPERVIVVYCGSRSCHASHAVARRLRGEVGLSPAYVLKGGWESWKAARE